MLFSLSFFLSCQDPRFALTEDVRRNRLRLNSTGGSTEHLGTSPPSPAASQAANRTTNRVPNSSSSSEFGEAHDSFQAQKLAAQSNSRLRKSSAPPKFSFFDFSMIPDKMERLPEQKGGANDNNNTLAIIGK